MPVSFSSSPSSSGMLALSHTSGEIQTKNENQELLSLTTRYQNIPSRFHPPITITNTTATTRYRPRRLKQVSHLASKTPTVRDCIFANVLPGPTFPIEDCHAAARVPKRQGQDCTG